MAVVVLSGQRQIEMLMRPFDQQQPCLSHVAFKPIGLFVQVMKNRACGPMTSQSNWETQIVLSVAAGGHFLGSCCVQVLIWSREETLKGDSFDGEGGFAQEIPSRWWVSEWKRNMATLASRTERNAEKKRSRLSGKGWMYSATVEEEQRNRSLMFPSLNNYNEEHNFIMAHNGEMDEWFQGVSHCGYHHLWGHRWEASSSAKQSPDFKLAPRV